MNYWTQEIEHITERISAAQVVKKTGKKRARAYKNIVGAFDIETTRVKTGGQRQNGGDEYRTFMYIWQLCIDGITCFGRTWDEFLECMTQIHFAADETIVIYVHNLAYEFSFLHGIYKFQPSDCFFMDVRKPLYCRIYKNIEFRCSYKLFNMNLARVMQSENVPAEYQKTEMNYDVMRYPWTELNEDELKYCENDVLGLWHAITNRLIKTGDNIATIPYTSTGYIRRTIKTLTHEFRPVFRDIAPEPKVYRLLRAAFRGGNTHANRAYVDCVNYDVHSVDIASSYPYVLCFREYPLTKWSEEKDLTTENIESLIYDKRHAVLMYVRFTGIDCGATAVPYISESKCAFIQPDFKHRRIDNGRLLAADVAEMAITDVDYKIIKKQYNPKCIEFLAVYTSIYKPMPAVVTRYIKKLYEDKTKLKANDPYFYARSKELLNATYGMSAQDILHAVIFFDGVDYDVDSPAATNEVLRKLILREDITEDPIKPEDLERGSLNNALPYCIGVWCTAYARERLQEGFEVVESQGGHVIYTDTDSIKFTGNVDFTRYNDEVRKNSYTVTEGGKSYTLGVYEYEETATKFKTLGAKKYVAMYGDELKITIAGVPKKTGAAELIAAGGIDKFEVGFIFRSTGKKESVYSDDEYIHSVDGRQIVIKSDVTLYPVTYELGITDAYKKLMQSHLTMRKAYDNMIMNMWLSYEYS